MSQPTDRPRPAGWQELEIRQRHAAGIHDRCRPGQCLIARASRQAADLTETLDQLAAQRSEPARCPGCGAQLPEPPHGCQTAGCDGGAS